MSLKLEAMRLKNFKSFKGTHEINGMDDHMTIIVGPNGSGKSNIIDSILFVLGYRAKKLRHSLLKDLIHNGCNECFVELIFNRFKVSRSIKSKALGEENENNQNFSKSCVSKYYLNDSEISSTDLMNFLKSEGIDLDNNRFLILQGEIENISMMGPAELLNYIEDCIGTSSYKTQIELIEQDLKNKEEELEMATNNLNFIESDYLFKKGKRDDKIDFLKSRAESLIFKYKIIKMKEEISRRKELVSSSEKQECLARLQGLSERNKEFSVKLQEFESKIESLNLKSKQDKLVQMKKKYQSLERENESRENKQNLIKEEILKIEGQIKNNEENIENWKNESETLKKSILANKNDQKKLEVQLEKKIKVFNSNKQILEFEKIKLANEAKLISLLKEKEEHDKLLGELEYLKSKISNLEALSFNLKETSKVNLDSLKKELFKLKDDMKITETEISNRKRRAEEFKHVEYVASKERETLTNLQHVAGVHGYLKNLGIFEEGYDVAIEAATKSLKSIVVDSTSVAEECIFIINKKRLSRTTFIILDRLTDYISGNENKNYLFKKIKCDSKYAKAFYFALKDTIVVNTLEEARKIAFGKVRQRVVTIDGKLLEKSGIMSGGKTSKKLKSVDELEKIYENMLKLYNKKKVEIDEIFELNRQKQAYEEHISNIGSYKQELKFKEQRVDYDRISALNEEISNIKENTSRQQKSIFSEDLISLKSEIEFLTANINMIEKMNQEYQITLNNSTNIDTKDLYIKLDTLKKEYNSIPKSNVFDMKDLIEKEAEYKQLFEEYKAMQNETNELRGIMGNDYHEEAQCKVKLDEIDEIAKECQRINRNCQTKISQLNTEYSMIKNLLREELIGFELLNDVDVEYLLEMTDNELKTQSKKMIEELNIKESHNFLKIKEKAQETENENEIHQALEDVELYKIIFEEYESSKYNYEKIKSANDYLKSVVESLKISFDNIKQERHSKFMEGFAAINKHIKEIFSMITFGGNAELDLIDFLNPFTEGVILSIMPPKKSWKQINNLSGGEKTLSSLSLIFALHKYKPSSFYVMDEIDAALDHKNVSIISQYLKHIKSQFLVISLRNDMFEMASTVLGVYKVQDVSRALICNVDRISML